MIAENTCVQLCATHTLTPNGFGLVSPNFEKELALLKSLINEEGILQPLVINEEGVIISGIRRWKVAQELGMETIPVIVVSPEDNEIERLVIQYNQYQEKKEVERYLEWERIKVLYGVGRGSRIDKNPLLQELKDNTIGHLSKSQYESYRKLFSLVEEVGADKNEIINKLMNGERVNSLKKSLMIVKSKKRVAEMKDSINISRDDLKLLNTSSFGGDLLEDDSVDCIITSPPYYQLRNYGNSTSDCVELGQEKSKESFINNLVYQFLSVKPKLKDTSKVWVNLMDTYRDGIYLNIVEEFICEMVKKGFFVLDKWVWVKNNSTPMPTRGANISHEHLICFGVNPNLPFNEMKVECDGMRELKEWSYNNGSKMKSSILVNEKVIESNANDFNELMKKCAKRGIPFTHSAGFPIEIPLLLIALSTEPGDLVVDLFSGTATTGEAALSLKRKYVGYEINPAYHEIAQVRLEDYIDDTVFTFYSMDEECLGEFVMAA